MKPDLDEFNRLADLFDIVPVVREIIADFETPVSILTCFLDEKEFFLLESVEGGDRSGCFSFIGLHPNKKFLIEDQKAYLLENKRRSPLSYKRIRSKLFIKSSAAKASPRQQSFLLLRAAPSVSLITTASSFLNRFL